MDKKFKIFVISALVLLACVAGVSTFVAITVMNRMSETQATSEKVSMVDSKNLVLLNLSEAITVNIVDEANKPHVVRVV
ncbi:MAG: hypothetical protein ACRCW2_16755, partial [Cellulosilyticaceae bacterium]